MDTIESLTLSCSLSSHYRPPHGKLARQSTPVEALQSSLTFMDPDKDPALSQLQSRDQRQRDISHAHPEAFYAHIDPQPRWSGPRGFGARHIHDDIPFSLWSEENQNYRHATSHELAYILDRYHAAKVEWYEYILVLQTSNPPNPVPLTVACTPVIFVPIGQEGLDIAGRAPYFNYRLADPCPNLRLPRSQRPEKSQMHEVVSALLQIAEVQRVNFCPASIIVELVYGDGRLYERGSLPYYVAGFPTTYHHDPIPFFQSMGSHTRERLLDPSLYLPGHIIGPLPQDCSNYLRDPNWGAINPGVRLSTGPVTSSGAEAEASQSTTCGVLLRQGSLMFVTVANHGFLANDSGEVFHPVADGDIIGNIVKRYPELDIAMVQLTPANSNRFTNKTYFQAEPPRRLAEQRELFRGTWFEVDGMSTGLLSFQYWADSMERPRRPPGHPPIPVSRWKLDITCRIFGATSPEMIYGLCGAPFVEERTGNVAGFFHLANGDWAECATLDDLVAEGYDVV
ncbi:hypothetical protein V491_03097 [Pseudogymnoascus sp. VKM F-3775]|nr:hypothetical protein V491_03097 [Pseudogymnoascus sp. VKM F-3775]